MLTNGVTLKTKGGMPHHTPNLLQFIFKSELLVLLLENNKSFKSENLKVRSSRGQTAALPQHLITHSELENSGTFRTSSTW